MFNLFSLQSGGTYIVQVRCKPDHGFWSEWSSSSYSKVPECKICINNYIYSSLHYISIKDNNVCIKGAVQHFGKCVLFFQFLQIR